MYGNVIGKTIIPNIKDWPNIITCNGYCTVNKNVMCCLLSQRVTINYNKINNKYNTTLK